MIFKLIQLKITSDPPKSDYFKQITTMMKWCGVMLEDMENPREAWFFRLYSLFLFVFCYYYYQVAQIMDLCDHIDDLEYASFSMCYMLSQCCAILKANMLLVNRKAYSKYLKSLESGLFIPNIERGGTNENILINTALRNFTVQSITIYFLVICAVMSRGITTLFERKYEEVFDPKLNQTVILALKVLPYNIYLPFDTQKYYFVAYLYEIFTPILYGFMIGAVDAMICGVMIHVKAQVLILKNSLSFIKDRAYKMYLKESKDKNCIKMSNNPLEKIPPEVQKYVTIIVDDVVKHHVQMIDLIDETEDMFNKLMLVQFMVSLFLMCFQLFQLSVTKSQMKNWVNCMNEHGSGREIMKKMLQRQSDGFSGYAMICYLGFMLFQLFMFCWNGNELAWESVDIANAVYDSDWIQFDTNCQKSMMLMIMRAQRAMCLTAGKFANLSLETYTTILRGSSSYYLALRQLNEG